MQILTQEHPHFARLWERLLQSHGNPTALISQSHFEYRAAYLGSAFERHVMVVVAEGETPILGSCFELTHEPSGRRELNAVASPSAMIVARPVVPQGQAGAEAMLRKHLDRTIQQLGVHQVRFVDQLVDGGLSMLSQWALGQGAVVEPRFEQVIDLTVDDVTLWRALSKSCQWGVNWGRKNLDVAVSTAPADIESLRLLHFSAAGTTTRALSTWNRQRKMVEDGDAFLVLAKLDGAVVSAAFFQKSELDCYYSVSASERSLFEKPLSHAVIWEAIKYAKQQGCARFQLGAQVWERFQWHRTAATAKEANISKFKRSFGGVCRAEFLIDLSPVSKEASSTPMSSSKDIVLGEVLPAALKDPAWSQGTSVFLRPLTADDVTERYLAWFSDDSVTRYLEVRSVTRREATDYIERGTETNAYFMCAVCDRESGRHIGNLKIGPIRWAHRVSDMVTVIGDRDFWGKGVATDAIRLASRLAFEVLGMSKLHASMYSGNVGSLRAYTRAGWHVEARLRNQGLIEGELHDLILISYFNPSIHR